MKFFKSPRLYLVFLLLNIISCSMDSKVIDEVVKVTKVAITSEAHIILTNTTAQLSVSVSPKNATLKDVFWSSSDKTIATIDSSGLITAVGIGQAIISVESQENLSIIDTLTITITGDKSNDITTVFIDEVEGVFNGNTITFEFFEGTDIAALAPTIVHNGLSIVPESGMTQDFSKPIIYNVVSENGESQEWVINVNVSTPPYASKFITTWKTDNPGASNDTQITIPTSANLPGVFNFDYNFFVSWGDGTFDYEVNGNITHTYETAGTYQVAIWGEFPHLYFGGGEDARKIVAVDQWGTMQWASMSASFWYCTNMDVIADDIPDLSMVTELTNMFAWCTELLGNSSMGLWKTISVTDMASTFAGSSQFNIDIGNWNVSNVTSMAGMFGGTSFNHDISEWNVSKVKNMQGMFRSNTAFNQDIGIWDVSNVTNMSRMLSYCYAFEKDLREWDVSNVSIMDGMFEFALLFDQNLANWNVANVADMHDMFLGATLSKANYDDMLAGWSSLSSLQPDIEFHAGNSTYCSGEAARQQLIDTYGWGITDAGKDCN